MRRFGKLLHRLWPRSMAGRVAIILVIGALIVQGAGSLLYYSRDRHGGWRGEREDRVAGRLIAVVRSFEAMPEAARPDLIRALDTPLLRVGLSDRAPEVEEGGIEDRRAQRLHARLRTALGARPFALEIEERFEFPEFEDEDGDGDDDGDFEYEGDWLLPGSRRFDLAVRLEDGAWLHVPTVGGPPGFRPFRVLFWVVLIAAAVVLVAGLSARRLARPFERFAEAADRLGTDIAAPPLEVAGSRELRRATTAFNLMQARIRRLVDDRTQMLAALAHDLRTFLTRFRLRVELIEDEEQQRKAVADLEAMRVMLDESLAFARDEAAGEARREFDLAALLQSLTSDAADAGQVARYQGPDRLRFTGRPVALGRALGNLIENAIRYGKRAEVELDEAGGAIEVRILDRGPGIPAAEREAVFRPFYRIEGSRSRETGGTGLGLAVARAVVHRHGGEITLGDRPGGGLLVRVRLPRTR